MKTTRYQLFLGLGLLVLAPFTARSQTINWASTASTTVGGNQAYLSNGSSMPNGFTFQLGAFGAGFNANDPTTWAGSWQSLASTTFNYPVAPSPFGYNFQAATNSTAAFFNKQAYILAFDNFSLLGQPGGEALLLTNPSWTFPDPVGPVPAQTWTVSSASSVLWGQIDGNIGSAGGEIQGGGTFTGERATNTFHMQTASFSLAPLPEPGSVTLLAAGLGLCLRRRRKN